MQASESESGKRIVVCIDADLMDLIPVFLENQQEEVDALVRLVSRTITRPLRFWATI